VFERLGHVLCVLTCDRRVDDGLSGSERAEGIKGNTELGGPASAPATSVAVTVARSLIW